ncbi:TetR/AcrR family transcriptional regulator [Roseobacter ponti]|uniref:TetR/AcrR family transcriptional regulator n=1 Tax=Roseobacter ponti TaxID=1891787 RepID=A0A858SUZ1_9RHOB|nr:TetR/AcrR family transcriptional regulator [Roseobacter ponti]QJF52534.1 TetR/AcrR family transcriptional regulator [Roseobacter ponti]
MAGKDKYKNGRGPARHTRDDWIRTALDTLICEGVGNVKIMVLSARLNTARSGFYWHFDSRADLLDRLLEHWRATNTRAITDSAARPADTICASIVNVATSWTGEGGFDTRLDFAIRDWARRSASVRAALDASDNERVGALTQMFQRHGFDDKEAQVRGRILYYTQIGHDALDQKEDLETRRSRTWHYLYCLSGQEPAQQDVDRLDAARMP